MKPDTPAQRNKRNSVVPAFERIHAAENHMKRAILVDEHSQALYALKAIEEMVAAIALLNNLEGDPEKAPTWPRKHRVVENA